MQNFLAELRRRNVFRIAAAYLIAAWVSIQVADVLLPTFDAPPATLRIMTIVLALLFPVVLAAAWTFEWTPGGFVRDTGDNIDRQAGVRVRRKMDYAILTLSVSLVISIVVTRDWSDDLAPASPTVSTTDTDRRSIAVLPFTNTSGKEDDLPLADGIAETLIYQLGQVKDLRVTARSSSFIFRDEKSDARSIGKRLGVSSILDGSVQRSGDKLRIIAQLVDTASGTQLWTAQFDRTLNDVFEMQDEISRSVIGALHVALLGAATAKQNSGYDPGVDAYQAYLIGRRAIERANPEAFKLAAASFEQAVSLAPDYALAYAGLGEAYMHLEGAGFADSQSMRPKAEAAIARALELDPLLGEAYAIHGRLAARAGDAAKAEPAFVRAIELSPSYAPAFLMYSLFLEGQSRANGNDEGLQARSDAMLQKAYELDPLSFDINWDLGLRAGHRGEGDTAMRHFRIAIETEPSFTGSYIQIGGASGRLDEAARWYRRAQTTYEGHWATAMLAGALIDMLDVEAAMQAVSAAPASPFGAPVFLDLAALRIASARMDDKVTADTAHKILAEIPYGFPWYSPIFEARRSLAYVYIRNGQCAEAIELYAPELEEYAQGGIPQAFAMRQPLDEIVDLGYVLLECDRADQAQALLADFVVHVRKIANTYENMDLGRQTFTESAALALLKRHDEAIEALDRAVSAGFLFGWSRLTDPRRDPRFDSIRDTPQFAALLQRLTEEAHTMRQSFADNPEVVEEP